MVDRTKLTKGVALFKQHGARVWEIDALRGFCILLMIFDHAMFDFTMLDVWFSNFISHENKVFEVLFDFSINSYWFEMWRITARLTVVCVFLFLSGISGVFSRNNILRSLKLSAAALALSSATIALDGFGDFGLTIIFGILHCLALSVFIYTLLKIALKDKAKYAFFGFGLLICAYALTFTFYYPPDVHDPLSFKDFIGIVLGFKAYGADYFGIFPYTGVFLLGAYAGEVFYTDRRSKLKMLDGKWNKPLCFVGRNTMWVYLFHQPIVLAVIIVLGLLVGYTI